MISRALALLAATVGLVAALDTPPLSAQSMRDFSAASISVYGSGPWLVK